MNNCLWKHAETAAGLLCILGLVPVQQEPDFPTNSELGTGCAGSKRRAGPVIFYHEVCGNYPDFLLNINENISFVSESRDRFSVSRC